MSLNDKLAKFRYDYYRAYKKELTLFDGMLKLILSRNMRYLFVLRLTENTAMSKLLLQHYSNVYGLEIPASCGEGLVLSHPHCITVNGNVRIGKNCTIFKGVTVGSIRSGEKKGTPTIGDNVVLCTNCMVCGNVNIGSDVLIAANAFVNFDVPCHSIVIGNPAQIHHKINATIDYV